MDRQKPTHTGSAPLSLLYVPCGTQSDAVALASALISERLVACANIHATRSLYRWDARLVDETEYVLICKTAPSLARAAAERAEALHQYDVPCVLTLERVAANVRYADWVGSELKGAGAADPTEFAEPKEGRG